jgi:hypothetical protein
MGEIDNEIHIVSRVLTPLNLNPKHKSYMVPLLSILQVDTDIMFQMSLWIWQW